MRQFCVHYQAPSFFNTLNSNIRNASFVSQFKSLLHKISTFTPLIPFPSCCSVVVHFFVWYLLLLSYRPHYVTVIYFCFVEEAKNLISVASVWVSLPHFVVG